MSWPDGEVSPLNIPGWRRFPLRARLAEQFPSLPVRLHNDAVCLAVAEHWLGAGRGSRDMLGMVVSTGVGGGLILGGRLAHGRTGNAGHIGHVVVEPHDGPRCTCGGHGCLEAVARGPALTSWALANGWHPNPRKPPGSRPRTDHRPAEHRCRTRRRRWRARMVRWDARTDRSTGRRGRTPRQCRRGSRADRERS
ncbi:hypothetical protein GCM10020001_033010 [Nonomuraea salmonea]